MTYILVTSADSKREMLEKNDGGREVELKEYLDNLEQVSLVDVNHQPICTYNEPQIVFSFLCIFFMYILRYKLAQNYSMTSQRFCEFGFPSRCNMYPLKIMKKASFSRNVEQ